MNITSEITTVPYVFHKDYCSGFFNHSKTTESLKKDAEKDFISNLGRFLKKLHVPPAFCIAESLYRRMAFPELSYHTPVHILSIFQFAVRHKIPLAWWEEMALWFHDGIYVPSAKEGENEWNSALFFEALVGPFIAPKKRSEITLGIHYTGTNYHLSTDVPAKYHLILDFDLCNFSFDSPGREVTSACLLDEFTPLFRKNLPLLIRLRIDFLKKLVGRGSIYRSNPFKSLEPAAMKYIAQQITVTEDATRIYDE